MLSSSRLTWFALVLGAAVAGCAPPKPWFEHIADLKSPRAGTRSRAAGKLRTDVGVPSAAICPLVEALRRERDEGVSYQLLRTLGLSGAPEAFPFIARALRSNNKKRRHEARHALRDWLIAQRRLRPGDDLDDIGL